MGLVVDGIAWLFPTLDASDDGATGEAEEASQNDCQLEGPGAFWAETMSIDNGHCTALVYMCIYALVEYIYIHTQTFICPRARAKGIRIAQTRSCLNT